MHALSAIVPVNYSIVSTTMTKNEFKILRIKNLSTGKYKISDIKRRTKEHEQGSNNTYRVWLE